MKIFNYLHNLDNLDNLASELATNGQEEEAGNAALIRFGLMSYLAQVENVTEGAINPDALEIINAWKATNDDQLANFNNDPLERESFETQGALADIALEIYHSWRAQVAPESGVEA